MAFSLSDTLAVLPGSFHSDSRPGTSKHGGIVYLGPALDTNKCWPIRPTLRNELDTFSVHFYVFFGPNISVPPGRAAVFAIKLMPVLDSGGVLNMELKLNVVSKWGSGGDTGAAGAGAVVCVAFYCKLLLLEPCLPVSNRPSTSPNR